MMPVNMRGPIAKAEASANHTAYLRVNVARDATPAGVQATIKRCFANNEHWGSWLFLHIGRVVGYTGMKLIYKLELARWRGCLWTGAFSNLGSWNGCGEWLVAPPVARSCPFGRRRHRLQWEAWPDHRCPSVDRQGCLLDARVDGPLDRRVDAARRLSCSSSLVFTRWRAPGTMRPLAQDRV